MVGRHHQRQERIAVDLGGPQTVDPDTVCDCHLIREHPEIGPTGTVDTAADVAVDEHRSTLARAEVGAIAATLGWRTKILTADAGVRCQPAMPRMARAASDSRTRSRSSTSPVLWNSGDWM